MAIRPGMTDLIQRVRRLIADAETSTTWDDEAIQDALDDYRQQMRYLPLCSILSYLPGGTVEYKEFESKGVGDWADSFQIVDSRYNVVVPESADCRAGRWIFADSYNQSLYVSGDVFDIYGAAADLLEAWAAKQKGKFDVRDRDAEIKRSQGLRNCLDLAAGYRSRQKVTFGTVIRSDLHI